MSAATPPLIFKGPIDQSCRKVHLQALCAALNLDSAKKNKDTLISLLRGHLFEVFPSLETDPRFTELYKYHAAHPKKSKAPSKNRKSTAKAAEELEEKSKTQKPITGANLKLLTAKVTTDPPGSFAPLSLRVKQEDSKHKEDLPIEDDLSELTSSSPPRSFPKDNPKDNEELLEDDADPDSPAQPTGVLVKFFHPHREEQAAQEVFVHNVDVSTSETPNGTLNHQTTLTKLIPAAIHNNSPMKNDQAGRFSRRGVSGGDNKMPIGSVAQHLFGPVPPNLQWTPANTIRLQPQEGGFFQVDLFYEPSETVAVPKPVTSLTGANTDQPLAIARARETIRAVKEQPVRQIATPHFCNYLRELVDTSLRPQTKSTTAGIALQNYIIYDTFQNLFTPYKQRGGGYLIPADFMPPASVVSPDWEQYRNISFTQGEIIEAAGLKSSSTRSNQSLFTKAKTVSGPLGDWVRSSLKPKKEDDPPTSAAQDETESFFQSMLYNDFIKRLNNVHEKEQRKLSHQLAGPSKASSSKRRYDSSSEAQSESEEEDEKKKKRAAQEKKKRSKQDGADERLKKKKKKSKPRNGDSKSKDSDHLDSPSEDSE
ncbi:hypothetical protein DFH09DRAFT_1327266 [Mycena vulgaris]|nr:hypothetical protein DFH09DRAFT_1327266 [Mycena vulgaris]